MHGWVQRDASSAIDWLLYFGEKKKNKEEKKVLDYYDGSVFVITAIMTYDDENKINDIYFTFWYFSSTFFLLSGIWFPLVFIKLDPEIYRTRQRS